MIFAVNKWLLMVSFNATYNIAKAKRSHTIALDLIKPCVLDMAEIILREKAGRKFDNIPCSNNTGFAEMFLHFKSYI